MPTMSVFGTDPAFQVAELTAAVQSMPFKPGRISASGLFTESNVNSLDVMVEQENGVLSLIPVSQRGAPADSANHAGRVVRSFRLPHVKQEDLITADQIVGVRAFGTDSEAETLARVLAGRMQPMVNSVEYTLESHRLAAVMGNYYNAGGATVSLFTEFGVTQQTVAMALPTATTKVRGKIMSVLEKIEDALGGSDFEMVRVMCGKNFWAELVDHPLVRDTYLSSAQAASMRADPRQEFEFGGVIFERYRGTAAVKVGDDDAYAVPVGVPELFVTSFGPADYIETAGTMGQKLYAKQWETEGGRGIKLEVQSNPLNICTRPAAVIKLTKI